MDLSIGASLISQLASDLSRPAAGESLAHLSQLAARSLPDLSFEHVLTRDGWYRSGGVVDGGYGRVADNIHEWTAVESAGSVDLLLEKYRGAGYFATRLQGRTHYLAARTGSGAADFVQLEVEELHEVLDRPLIDPDWMPDDLEEFLDPMDYPRLEPESVSPPRLVFRRITHISELIREKVNLATENSPLQRFLSDWESCSAGRRSPFSQHWVLSIRETPTSDGGSHTSAKPVPVCRPVESVALGFTAARGAELANRIQTVDHECAYPMAWYFTMLSSRKIPFWIGEVVAQDLSQGYEYLPQADSEVVRRWDAEKYSV